MRRILVGILLSLPLVLSFEVRGVSQDMVADRLMSPKSARVLRALIDVRRTEPPFDRRLWDGMKAAYLRSWTNGSRDTTLKQYNFERRFIGALKHLGRRSGSVEELIPIIIETSQGHFFSWYADYLITEHQRKFLGYVKRAIVGTVPDELDTALFNSSRIIEAIAASPATRSIVRRNNRLFARVTGALLDSALPWVAQTISVSLHAIELERLSFTDRAALLASVRSYFWNVLFNGSDDAYTCDVPSLAVVAGRVFQHDEQLLAAFRSMLRRTKSNLSIADINMLSDAIRTIQGRPLVEQTESDAMREHFDTLIRDAKRELDEFDGASQEYAVYVVESLHSMVGKFPDLAEDLLEKAIDTEMFSAHRRFRQTVLDLARVPLYNVDLAEIVASNRQCKRVLEELKD